MQIEIFEEKSTAVNLGVFDQWERKIELIRELGLKGQEAWISAYERAKNIPFKILTPEELAVWEEFLPTVYTDQPGVANHHFDEEDTLDLQGYTLDFIPLPVLEIWSECKLKGYFSSYQIRSAEEDPVLIGMIGPLRFLIARWGESLRPFEVIKERLGERMEERTPTLRRSSRIRPNPFRRALFN
ncbi:MAG: hypothetical protein HY200_09470 [Nitrospirae bacterium]|nr:hypothetical protein [Nitrospirota bacterium]MBI3595172.1 hypothetical protein [Nitrospirota bacterium]